MLRQEDLSFYTRMDSHDKILPPRLSNLISKQVNGEEQKAWLQEMSISDKEHNELQEAVALRTKSQELGPDASQRLL